MLVKHPSTLRHHNAKGLTMKVLLIDALTHLEEDDTKVASTFLDGIAT